MTINSYVAAIKRTAICQVFGKDTTSASLDTICNRLFGLGYDSYARDFAKHLVQNGVSFTNVKKALWENKKGVLIKGNEDAGLKSWGDLNDPQIFEYAKAYTAIIRQKIEDQNNHV